MSRVIGSASEARELKRAIFDTRNQIVMGIANLDKAGKRIEGAWKDEGSKQVREIVLSINKALQTTENDFVAAEKALESYAVFLDSLT